MIEALIKQEPPKKRQVDHETRSIVIPSNLEGISSQLIGQAASHG